MPPRWRAACRQGGSLSKARSTVLVIDDDPMVCDTTRALLEGDGYLVETCLDGISGLTRAADLLPDVVLLDVMMPGLDGYEVCRRMRLHPQLSEVPIVMITVLDDPESRLEGIEAGADDFVSKPYDRAELRARVRTITRLNRYRGLLEERDRFASLAELSPYGLAIATVAGEIRFSNAALLDMLCESSDTSLCGANFLHFVDPEMRPAFELQLDNLRNLEGAVVRSLEVRLLSRRGDYLWVAVDAGLLEWERGPAMQLLVRDISDQKRYQSELERRTNFDTLTGLANRNLLNDRLDQALLTCKKGKFGAVVMVDLDRFQAVNDSFSMAAGDDLLREVSRRLGACVGPGDTVARFAGDQFALIVTELESPADAAALAERLLREISAPLSASGRRFSVTGSLGLSLFPATSTSRDELLQQAELALYKSKEHGGCFRVYEPAMSQGLPARLELEHSLREAVAHNQLMLMYQPRVSATGLLVGAEALVRWQHPTRGLIPPLDFIPLAEETGLITSIGRWVLTEATRQLAAWREQGLPAINVGVNVSPRQFRSDDVVALSRSLLHQFDVPASCLGLEITESAMMDDPEGAAKALLQLHGLGIELSLDDFGTGYSSLSYLTRLPLSYLKIDRSFVQHVTTRTADAVLATKLIQLAGSLGFRTVAEGVETAEQLRFLVEQGCDQLQGYYFSKPLPAEEFATLLSSGRRWQELATAVTG